MVAVPLVPSVSSAAETVTTWASSQVEVVKVILAGNTVMLESPLDLNNVDGDGRGRLGGELDGVGGCASLGDGKSGLGKIEVGLVIVFLCGGDGGFKAGVFGSRSRVIDLPAAVDSIVVVAGGDGDGLRGTPSRGREGKRGRAHRDVGVASGFTDREGNEIRSPWGHTGAERYRWQCHPPGQ